MLDENIIELFEAEDAKIEDKSELNTIKYLNKIHNCRINEIEN